MTIQELIIDIQKLLLQINHQFQARNNGMAGPGTINELDLISSEFSNLLSSLMHNSIPSKDKRHLSSARIVTDSWDINEPLAEEICRIDYLYTHELE